jgi:hypothetical protein
MRTHFIAAGAFAGAVLFAGPAVAQTGFGAPSCVATLVSGPAAAFKRFVPTEVKGPAAMQIRGVVARSLTWRPGETLKICFKAGSRGAHERVMRVAREWMLYADIVFDFEDNGVPRRCAGDGREDIKIDFVDNKGWWSAYGTLSRQRDPSMNLQFFGVDTPRHADGRPAPERELRRIILHEFGHALGMMHEHQSPVAACDGEIDWDAAYRMGQRMGWDREQVHAQMRALTQVAEFNMTEVDRRSIMHYSLPPELFKAGKSSRCWVPDNDDLSETDRRFIAAVYPKAGPPVHTSGLPRPPPGAATRGAKPPVARDGREELVSRYEALLKQAGLAAGRIAQLTQDFRKAVFAR